jgi:hypothetical protein
MMALERSGKLDALLAADGAGRMTLRVGLIQTRTPATHEAALAPGRAAGAARRPGRAPSSS